ncbi:NAD-dependent epimerase/dehydratase family protein [Oxalobacteraceae bacterium CAVE-383]|nr:NAD-dependent epimerase/dehydratase family protein [Oxalobacteraceae bacterium CAVE-383]
MRSWNAISFCCPSKTMPHIERVSQNWSGTPGNVKSVLIVGADSTIGRGLLAAFEATAISVWSTSRRNRGPGPRHLLLDLSQSTDDWMLPSSPVDVAFLCAAVTSQAQCESDPEATHEVNVEKTCALAKELTAAGTFVVFISTSLVLDGQTPYANTKQSINPQTIYGRQKAEAEQYLLGLGDAVAVVRFGKVIAPGAPLFENWATDLRAGKIIHPFSDMVIAPVALPFAVEVLRRVAQMQCPGILQASAANDITYAEAAQIIAKNVGADPALVVPVSRLQTAGLFSPRHTTFDAEGLTALGLVSPPSARAFGHFSSMHLARDESLANSASAASSIPLLFPPRT